MPLESMPGLHDLGEKLSFLFNKYFLSKYHVNAWNIGLNLSVLVPAFMESSEREECQADDHIITKHGTSCSEDKTGCYEKSVMENFMEIGDIQVPFLSEEEH